MGKSISIKAVIYPDNKTLTGWVKEQISQVMGIELKKVSEHFIISEKLTDRKVIIINTFNTKPGFDIEPMFIKIYNFIGSQLPDLDVSLTLHSGDELANIININY